MKKITISQNRSNWWTFVGLIMSVILGSTTCIYIFYMWPPALSFFGLLMPTLAIASTILCINYTYWLLVPKNALFEISEDYIRVSHQPMFKWKIQTFSPNDIKMINHNPESGTILIDNSGNHFLISDILMMRKKEIYESLNEMHPHIITK
jgi:hypothetical protein